MAEARAAVGYRHLQLDHATHTARLLVPGMRLDLGGIAMGYAVDEAIAVLRARGIDRALVDASGDIGVGDSPPGKMGWTIGVVPLSADGTPSREILLANAAVATSGDAFQHVEIDGKRYSHIVDPRTGLGLTDRIGVAVIARDCLTADSLGTAVSVLGPKAGLALVEDTPGAAAFIVRPGDDGQVETFASARFRAFRHRAAGSTERADALIEETEGATSTEGSQMNVFVAGATGVLGRRLVRQLTDRGHKVVGLVRNRDGERSVAAQGGEPRYADLFDPVNLVHAVKGAEVVIHAATAIPTKARTSLEDWQIERPHSSRGDRGIGPLRRARSVHERFCSRASSGSPIRPTAPCSTKNRNRTPTPSRNRPSMAKAIAQEMSELHGFAAAVLRCGMFYGADAGHTKMMARGLAARRLPIIGSGKNYWHSLHLDDAAGGFVAAAEAGRAGLWHLVDDEPVHMGELLTAFAARLGRQRRVACRNGWRGCWPVAPPSTFSSLSTRTTNARFRRDFGWSPMYPTYREGLDQVVSVWNGHVP